MGSLKQLNVPVETRLTADVPKPTPSAVAVAISEVEPSSAATRPSELTQAQALTFAALIALTCALPMLYASGPFFRSNIFVRGPTDLFAFVTFLPALVAAAYFSKTESHIALPPVALFGRFAYGWLVLLPVAVFAAPSCILLYWAALSPVLSTTYMLYQPQLESLLLWAAALFCVTIVELALLSLAIPSKDRFTQVGSHRRFVLYALFTTLGLGTGEAYFWILFSQRTVQSPDRITYLASILLSFSVVLLPMQVLCSYHIGLGVAHREVMKTKHRPLTCIVLPLVSRWAFLVVTLALPAITNMQWMGLTGLLLIPVYVLAVRRDELQLPAEYLSRSGSMNAFGFGVLKDADGESQPVVPTVKAQRT